MANSILADTGPLYALVDQRDQYHPQAVLAQKTIAQNGIQVIIPYPILCECYTLILYRFGNSVVTQWLQQINACAGLINPTVTDYMDAQPLLKKYSDQRISYFDALLAALSQKLELSIWTFDKHFEIMRCNRFSGGA